MSTEHSTENLGGKDGGAYSKDGSAAHYKNDAIEYTDMIEELYGTSFVKHACNTQVIKYRMRAGKKAGVTADKDLVKADYYAKLVEFYNDKIRFRQGVLTTKDISEKYQMPTEDVALRFMYRPLSAAFIKDMADEDFFQLQNILDLPNDIRESHVTFQTNDEIIKALTPKEA